VLGATRHPSHRLSDCHARESLRLLRLRARSARPGRRARSVALGAIFAPAADPQLRRARRRSAAPRPAAGAQGADWGRGAGGQAGGAWPRRLLPHASAVPLASRTTCRPAPRHPRGLARAALRPATAGARRPGRGGAGRGGHGVCGAAGDGSDARPAGERHRGWRVVARPGGARLPRRAPELRARAAP